MTAKLAPPPTARHACEVETTCQPPSAWAKDPWPCVIRDISTDGLSLTLSRRFERGSGLAIELPGDDGATSTVLARVSGVQPYPDGGWMLDVGFISELSDDEVGQVLHLSALAQARLEDDGPAPVTVASVASVLFQARIPGGGLLRWYVKRLDHPGEWPLAKGRSLRLRVPGASALSLVVRKCRHLGGFWIVDCRLTEVPAPDVMRLLEAP